MPKAQIIVDLWREGAYLPLSGLSRRLIAVQIRLQHASGALFHICMLDEICNPTVFIGKMTKAM
jgi:hypothetical protein